MAARRDFNRNERNPRRGDARNPYAWKAKKREEERGGNPQGGSGGRNAWRQDKTGTQQSGRNTPAPAREGAATPFRGNNPQGRIGGDRRGKDDNGSFYTGRQRQEGRGVRQGGSDRWKQQQGGARRGNESGFPSRSGGQQGERGERWKPRNSERFGQKRPPQFGRPATATRDKTKPVDLHAIARKAMRNYDFEPEFPAAVMAQVDAMADAAKNPPAGMRDLRGLLWSSIDNFDTEDLDQIEYCEQGKNGEILAKVAVADVDIYVPKDSPADMHARANTTSVYTGIETYPMIPDRLSKNLSSLMPDVDRLAMVIEFTVLPHGQVKPGEIYRAIVRNRAKLVYEEVGAWLEGTGPAPKLIAENRVLEVQVRLQNEASLRLGKYRMNQGALELESLEARAVIENEKVLGLALIEENPARRIIENFMIGANGTMSGYLERANTPTIQRVVRVPKDWPEIVALAKKKGSHLPKFPDAKALSVFLAKQRQADPERFPDLSLAIVKLIGNGEYVMYDKRNPLGHFCLAVTSYTHSTAPNRRYVDLIIQRLVKAALKREKSPYSKKELELAAAACTEREHAAKKVERFMVKAEAAALLMGKLGQMFDALITGASDKGIYARLLDPPVEGKVIKWVKGLHVGQKVKVRLVNLDPWNGFIDLDVMGWR